MLSGITADPGSDSVHRNPLVLVLHLSVWVGVKMIPSFPLSFSESFLLLSLSLSLTLLAVPLLPLLSSTPKGSGDGGVGILFLRVGDEAPNATVLVGDASFFNFCFSLRASKAACILSTATEAETETAIPSCAGIRAEEEEEKEEEEKEEEEGAVAWEGMEEVG